MSVETIREERKEYTEKFSPLVDAAIERLNNKTGALVFRHVIDWMGEEEHLEAAFIDAKRARDFASMMESPNERWTVVTVYPDSDRGMSAATSVLLGSAEVFHGGQIIKRVRFD